MKIFISGMPGCGKTTLILELIKELKARGKKVAGIITPELRKGRSREAFLIRDLASKKQEVLASVQLKAGPRVSKYRVNVDGIDKIVQEAEKSFDSADVIIVDEIGKMELFSKAFKAMISKLLKTDKSLIATVHRVYAKNYSNYGHFIWLEKNKVREVKERILLLLA